MAENAPLPSIDANTLAQMIGVAPKEVYDLTKAGVIERGMVGSTRSRTACGGTAIGCASNGLVPRQWG